MPPDYNLVIIGGTAAARYAALTASRLKARVALIEPEFLGDQTLRHQTLIHVGRVAQQMRQVDQWGLPGENFDPTATQWTNSLQWAQWVTEVQDEGRSLPILAASGVDVIIGEGEFVRRPQLAFAVNGRSLRSRTYLIASGSRSAIPKIDGFAAAQPCTPETFWRTPPSPPAHVVIVGGEPIGLELAQTLVQLGYQVTLVVNRRLLPHEDAEAAYLIQTCLEAEGVQILSQTPVTQVKRLDNKKWVQAGDRALEADEIIVATRQMPLLDPLNLEAAGVKFMSTGIPVNDRLQTTNPRVYACGEALGGYPFPHVALYEAAIALKNALFFPVNKTDYRTVPWALFTDPELARVGLTEAQVVQQLGKDQFEKNVIVLRQPFKALAKSQILGKTTGFCKLIVHRNGKIFGAHLVGADASETVGAIALAIRQNLSIQTLATLPTISPTWAEIVQQTAMEWEKRWGDRHPFQQNLLESWFNFRR